jgi:vanillate O-demethylase monooxygenase subunit
MLSVSKHEATALRQAQGEKFLRNQWYCAALSHELKSEPFGRIFLNEPVVLYRKADGGIVALEDRCCHRRAPLSKGKIEGDNLRCGYHGFLYDAQGQVIWVPGQDKVPPEAKVRAYPVVEKHGFIWIWMGEPSLADPAKAPEFWWRTHPDWASWTDYLPIKANYLLVVDNLMDLSHVPFLHINTIGSAEDTDPTLKWERGPDWSRGTRTARNLTPPLRWRLEGINHNIDQVKVMTYTPPANVLIDILTTDSQTKPGENPLLSQRLIVLDSMTPETDNSCHYFFGNCRDYKIDKPEITAMMAEQTVIAFNEDKAILEAEQRIIDLDPAAPQIDVMGDTGGLQSRRIVDRLLAEERRSS